jgi:hypothetical protein
VVEALGSALALKLLLDLPLWIGVLVTGLDTLIVLSLKGHGFRQLEAIVVGRRRPIGANIRTNTLSLSYRRKPVSIHSESAGCTPRLQLAASLGGNIGVYGPRLSPG